MKTARIHILEKRRRFADVEQKNVDIAVVEDVAESGAAPGLQGQFLEACLPGDFVKRAVAIVAMQQQRLAKPRTGFQRVNLRINVAVSNENVEPGVVVHVEESGAPANVRIAGLADAGSPTDVVESLGAHVAIERVGLLLKVRNKEAQTPAVVVIAPVDAHVAEFHA